MFIGAYRKEYSPLKEWEQFLKELYLNNALKDEQDLTYEYVEKGGSVLHAKERVRFAWSMGCKKGK